MKTIKVLTGSKLDLHLQQWLADRNEIKAELRRGNKAIYQQKGLKLADPLSYSPKS